MRRIRVRGSSALFIGLLFLACLGGAAPAQEAPAPPPEPPDDLALYRLVERDGELQLLVNRGTPEQARKYYGDVNQALGITSGDIFETDLNDLLRYGGYETDAARIEVTPSAELMNDRGIKATVFFAPKIVDVSGTTQPPGYGWRKLVRFETRDGSRAKAAGIRALWLLFNFASEEPRFPGGRAGQIQAILEAFRPNPYPVYFFVYETFGAQDRYRLRLFLNASFDAGTGGSPDEKYYVPHSCAQCHGDTSSGMQRVKLNYLDTDHWFDRAGDPDFPDIPAANVLPDGGAPGSPGFEPSFEVYRHLNREIRGQNFQVSPDSFQFRAADLWVRLHLRSSAHVPALERGAVGTNVWTALFRTDKELLPELNRLCFRCHSSFAYHVFDKSAVKERAVRGSIQRIIRSGSMPQDRQLDEATRANLIRLFDELAKQP